MFEPIKISGAVEIQATPVHPHSTTENVEVQQRVSENKSKEVETDEEDDTPNLMVEIANSLDARTEAEPEVFAVDESTETIEYEMPWHNHHADNVTEENLDLPLEIDLTEVEVLILNEDAVANPATNDATEEDDKSDHSLEDARERGRAGQGQLQGLPQEGQATQHPHNSGVTKNP